MQRSGWPTSLSTPGTLDNWTDGRVSCRHSASTLLFLANWRESTPLNSVKSVPVGDEVANATLLPGLWTRRRRRSSSEAHYGSIYNPSVNNSFVGRARVQCKAYTRRAAGRIVTVAADRRTLQASCPSPAAGASIPMGQGGHVPPIFGLGGHYHECPPPNISRVISATFYPCNIFLISWKSF